MKRWLVWLVGPALTLGAAYGAAFGFSQQRAAAAPSDPGEALLARALEDLAWTSGSPGDVRAVLQNVRAKGEATVRTRLRLAVVAQTPDARAALLSELCAQKPELCDSLPEELARVAATRKAPAEYHLLAPPSGEP